MLVSFIKWSGLRCIIVDEFHHAEAPSYGKLLDYYKPEILLGLTATSERMDGKNILERFDDRIPSIAVLGDSDSEERNNAKRRLVKGEVKFIFTIDLYNEGVDIPEINTVLFLRPTESLTVFLQQLGRGLRICEEKGCLIVLDFVGKAHKNYDFEQKFKALIGKSKHSVEYNINNGFLNLTKGCYIHLEKQAKEYILRNIKAAKLTKASIISKLKYFEEDTSKKLTLSNFLEHYNYTFKSEGYLYLSSLMIYLFRDIIELT